MIHPLRVLFTANAMAAVALLLLCFVWLFFEDVIVNILNPSISEKSDPGNGLGVGFTLNVPSCYLLIQVLRVLLLLVGERQLRPNARPKSDRESDSELLSRVRARE